VEVSIKLWIIIWEYFLYHFTVRLPSGIRTDFLTKGVQKVKRRQKSCFVISGHISGHHRKILNLGIGRIDTIFSRCEVVWRRIFHIGHFEIGAGTFDCKNCSLHVLLERFLWRFLHPHYLALKWPKLLWKKFSCYFFVF